MVFCFVLPLQCFIIGDYAGLGVQGAVFRYQITGQGTSLMPVIYEIEYVTSGVYQGKNAVSVILWIMGTLVLVCTTILSLIYWNNIPRRALGFIFFGIAGSCILYLGSCVVRYGLLFSGPSGTSLPLGILMMAVFAAFLHLYQSMFNETNAESGDP